MAVSLVPAYLRLAASVAVFGGSIAPATTVHGSVSVTARLLEAHNKERALAGVPPLRWDERLSADARRWSEELSRTGRLAHAPEIASADSVVGENIWTGTADRFSPEQMVDAWVREKKHFRPGVFPNISATGRVSDVGHYTQVVWRGTKAVGCAIAPGVDGEILVCRYSEGGNIYGEPVF
jgi:uncharacterized protein YkwD